MLRYDRLWNEGSGVKAYELSVYSLRLVDYLGFTLSGDDRVQHYRLFSDHLNYIRCIEFLHRPNRWGTKA
jgi:hypothetical protein